MIRLELTFSTLSLVSLLAALFSLIPAILGFYVGHSSSQTLLKSSALAAAVFMLLSTGLFLATAFVVFPRRTEMVVAGNVAALVGTLVAGLCWFGGELAATMTAKHGNAEIAFVVFWVLDMMVASVACTYSLVKLTGAAASTDDPVALYDEKLGPPPERYGTPQHQLMGSVSTFSYGPPYSTHRYTDSGSTLPNSTSSPKDKRASGLWSHQHSPNFNSLKPSFRAHHQSDSTLFSYPTAMSAEQPELSTMHTLAQNSHHQLLLSPPQRTPGPPQSPKKHPHVAVKPAVLPKHRKPSTGGTGTNTGTAALKLLNSSMRKFSNGTRQLSNSLLSGMLASTSTNQQRSKSPRRVATAPTVSHTMLTFDEWEVNADSLKNRLLLSRMSNLSPTNPRTRTASPTKSYAESTATSINWAVGGTTSPPPNKLLTAQGFVKRSVTPAPPSAGPRHNRYLSTDFSTNSDDEWVFESDDEDDEDMGTVGLRLGIDRVSTTVHYKPHAPPSPVTGLKKPVLGALKTSGFGPVRDASGSGSGHSSIMSTPTDVVAPRLVR